MAEVTVNETQLKALVKETLDDQERDRKWLIEKTLDEAKVTPWMRKDAERIEKARQANEDRWAREAHERAEEREVYERELAERRQHELDLGLPEAREQAQRELGDLYNTYVREQEKIHNRVRKLEDKL